VFRLNSIAVMTQADSLPWCFCRGAFAEVLLQRCFCAWSFAAVFLRPPFIAVVFLQRCFRGRRHWFTEVRCAA
jgi:hypothetical protein